MEMVTTVGCYKVNETNTQLAVLLQLRAFQNLTDSGLFKADFNQYS